MSPLVHPGWLMSQVLRRLPGPWLAALDDWSHGVALKQRDRRRMAAQRPQPAQPIPYKLKPWRD